MIETRYYFLFFLASFAFRDLFLFNRYPTSKIALTVVSPLCLCQEHGELTFATATKMKRATLVPKEETVPICPVKNAPICPEGRARTLPGFHLISIDAAVEAMEKGIFRFWSDNYLFYS